MEKYSNRDHLPDPHEIIFSCSICHATITDIYDQKSIADDGFVTKLWLTECAHLTCSKHLSGGGAPFHRKCELPRAPCPVCEAERDDTTLKSLFSIQGPLEGQHNELVPQEWFSVPPVALDNSMPGMQALRFQYLSLIRFGTHTFKKLRDTQTALDILQQEAVAMRGTVAHLENSVLSLEQQLANSDAEACSWREFKSREAQIHHYLQEYVKLARENKLLKGKLETINGSVDHVTPLADVRSRRPPTPMSNGMNPSRSLGSRPTGPVDNPRSHGGVYFGERAQSIAYTPGSRLLRRTKTWTDSGGQFVNSPAAGINQAYPIESSNQIAEPRSRVPPKQAFEAAQIHQPMDPNYQSLFRSAHDSRQQAQHVQDPVIESQHRFVIPQTPRVQVYPFEESQTQWSSGPYPDITYRHENSHPERFQSMRSHHAERSSDRAGVLEQYRHVPTGTPRDVPFRLAESHSSPNFAPSQMPELGTRSRKKARTSYVGRRSAFSSPSNHRAGEQTLYQGFNFSQVTPGPQSRSLQQISVTSPFFGQSSSYSNTPNHARRRLIEPAFRQHPTREPMGHGIAAHRASRSNNTKRNAIHSRRF